MDVGGGHGRWVFTKRLTNDVLFLPSNLSLQRHAPREIDIIKKNVVPGIDGK
jgi:hypothetical protein